jgi:hypothetical protein
VERVRRVPKVVSERSYVFHVMAFILSFVYGVAGRMPWDKHSQRSNAQLYLEHAGRFEW